jgi:hypothetical protein
MTLKRLMARMACHQEAVTAARSAGETWMEIGARLGIGGEAARKAYSRAQAAVQAGRLVPREQLPLPDSTTISVPAAPPAVQPKASPSPFEPLTGEQRPARPGWTQIPIDKPLNK